MYALSAMTRKPFRLWRQTLEVDEEDSSRRRPVWICQYKVSSPSGYANFDTPSQGADFHPTDQRYALRMVTP